MVKGPIKKEDYVKLQTLINQIEKEPNAAPFIDPVDWKALDLLDYPKIVKKPMDLTTCRNKLKNKQYETYDAFFADIQLIWDNCKLYNIAESEIYRMAEDLEATTKKMISKLKGSLGLSATNKKRTREDEMKSDDEDDEDEEAEISFDLRIKFTDYVRKLTIEQMTTLVRMIQEECPRVLEDLDSDRLQIKVDDIDKNSFDKLMDFLKTCVDKDAKMKLEEENSKSNNDEEGEPSGQETPAKKRHHDDDDEESKNEGSIDSSKYGPEGKRVKTS